VQHLQGEHRPLAGPTARDRSPVLRKLERTQEPNLHRSPQRAVSPE